MSDSPHDYYAELNVAATASFGALHAAYRARARRIHPDVVGDDTAMKRLNVAWDILRHPEKRAAYDRQRAAAFRDDTVVTSTAPINAGPPPGHGFGPVLTFGRYAGWTIGEVALEDPEFLRWLRNVPNGRGLRRDIDAVFAELQARPRTLGGRRPAFSRG
ncbi:MAG TPA: DnaJ domain-containing protein [Candidatus Acidoferrales bacterium]|jgi:curved DNA-binding protein CbpA|nr:DnaJ domain-containing protein [Candidatus Acidoferrales bacterium]